MNLFNLEAVLSMDTSEYDRGLSNAENKTGSLKNTITKLGIGTAVAGIGKAAIGVGQDFEAGMSQVAATMGISSDAVRRNEGDFKLLSDAAKEAGSTTQFSATQSAEALNYLALAGNDAQTSVSLLPTVLNAAAAGGLELGYASDLITDSMSALGLETEDTTTFVDQLAKTSQKSNTSLGQLGEAILTVGGTAKKLKGGTVELNTALGILADNGIKGAEGGTALRNVILSLSAPTDSAAKELKKLGVNAYDANGNFRSLDDIFIDLYKSTDNLSESAKNQAFTKIFNKTDLKAVEALLASTGGRFDELSGAIEQSGGAAEEMAKTMNTNLKGSLTTLSSALEGMGIAIFEKFKEPLTKAVDAAATSIQNLIKAFNEGKLDKTLIAIGSALAGVVTYMGLMKGYAIVTSVLSVGKALLTAASMVKSFSGALALLKAAIAAIGGPVTLVISGISALVAGFVYLWNTSDGFRNFWIGLWEDIKKATTKSVEAISEFFTTTLPNAFKTAMNFIKDNWQGLLLTLVAGPVGIFKLFYDNSEKFRNKVNEVVEDVKKYFAKMGEGISNTFNSIKQWTKDTWDSFKQKVKEAIENVHESLVKFSTKVWEFFYVTIPNAIQKGIEVVSKFFLETLPNTVSAGIEAVKTFLSNLPRYIGEVIGFMVGIVIRGVMVIINTITQTWTKVVEFFKNLPNMIKQGLDTAYNNINQWATDTWNSITQWATNTWNSITQWASNTWNTFTQWCSDTWNSITQWGKDTWDSIIQWGKNTYDSIVQWGKDTWDSFKQWTKNTIETVSNWASDMWNKAKETGKNFVNSIVTFFSQLPGKVKTWFDNTIQKAIQWKNDMVNKAKDTGKEFGKWLEDSLKELPNKMKNIGKNIVEGVWNGIKNAKDWFMGNVKSFFGGIVDGAKSALGIHSPSREMRDEVGKWIPAGVEVGIKREMPKLNETVQDEFNNLSNINVPIPRISNENAQSNNLSNARNTVIEVPLNLDGVEIARAIIEPFKLIEGDYERSHNVKFAY